MARGFESKAVEEAQRKEIKAPAKRQHWSEEQIDAARKRESLELSKKRITSELKVATAELRKTSLEAALKHLNDELAKLP